MMLNISLSKKNRYIIYSIQQRPLQDCEGMPVRLKLIIVGDLFQNHVKLY